jgi:hypothetical protein
VAILNLISLIHLASLCFRSTPTVEIIHNFKVCWPSSGYVAVDSVCLECYAMILGRWVRTNGSPLSSAVQGSWTSERIWWWRYVPSETSGTAYLVTQCHIRKTGVVYYNVTNLVNWVAALLAGRLWRQLMSRSRYATSGVLQLSFIPSVLTPIVIMQGYSHYGPCANTVLPHGLIRTAKTFEWFALNCIMVLHISCNNHCYVIWSVFFL